MDNYQKNDLKDLFDKEFNKINKDIELVELRIDYSYKNHDYDSLSNYLDDYQFLIYSKTMLSEIYNNIKKGKN